MLIVNKDIDDVYNSDYFVELYTNYTKGEAFVYA